MEYNNQFTKQPYVFKGTFSFELNMPYDETVRELMPIKGSGTFEGISEQDKQNMSMAMQLDTEALKKYISTEAPDEETAEIANSVVSALEDVKINYITDISTGKMYLQCPMFALAGMDGDAWYYMDLNEIYSSMDVGMNFTELMDMVIGNDMTFEDYIKSAFASVPLTSVNDYNDFQTSIATFVDLFSDNAFEQQSDGYVSQFDFNENGVDVHFTFKVLSSGESVIGYDMNVSAGISGTNFITLNASQNNTDATVVFNLNVPDVLNMVFNCGMTMEPTEQKAISQPSGNIINIMDAMEDVA